MGVVSEPRIDNEKFRFVSIWFQFVNSHPVSNIDKTGFNPGNCSGKINAIITTEGGVQHIDGIL